MNDLFGDQEEINRLFTALDTRRAATQEAVRGVLGSNVVIDEMALLFTEHTSIFRFISQAVQLPGVELFNFAKDTVQTAPIHSEYVVQYWFLTSGLGPWRIEAMIQDNASPLHHALSLNAETGTMTVVHGSFKCAGEMEYGTARHALRTAGWEEVQRGDSAYGRFSYWDNPDERYEGVYLKPRVNLRDAE